MKKTGKVFVGIDVSKVWLDVAVHEQKEGCSRRLYAEIAGHLECYDPYSPFLAASTC